MIFTRNGSFYDESGRQVILHGINLVNKDARSGYLGEADKEDFARMRSWGFNCVRLGVIWDGLEPEPGKISQAYLTGTAQRVQRAKENGLYVILDMHQDLYSVLFSDGAPEWATLTDGKEHLVEGGVWSDAYFTSPAVQAALDHFWMNSPAIDGIGLQDHFAAAWQALAQRFNGEEIVIGFDLFNEPFPGSAAVESQYLLFARGAELLAGLGAMRNDDPGAQKSALETMPSGSAEELAQQWLDPGGRYAILRVLDNADLFAQVIDVTEPIYAAFEAGPLMGLYQRTAKAIREAAPDKILFLETSMGSNMGVRSAIRCLSGADGRPDPQQAYAPHGYDLVVDTENIANSSSARVELIFARHAETARQLGLAMLVGEWGAFDRRIPGTLPAAWDVSRQFERHLCSDTYWHYEKDLDSLPAFQAISRPYVERITGSLLHYEYDPAQRIFSCAWIETANSEAPTRVYFPGWMKFAAERIRLWPENSGYSLESGMGGTWLSIPPNLGEGNQRELRFV